MFQVLYDSCSQANVFIQQPELAWPLPYRLHSLCAFDWINTGMAKTATLQDTSVGATVSRYVFHQKEKLKFSLLTQVVCKYVRQPSLL
jgi:hypothetical protein